MSFFSTLSPQENPNHRNCMNLKKTFFILLFVLLSASLSRAEPKQQAITMNFPANIVQDVLTKSLPLQLAIDSNTILGSVSIDTIKELKIHKNKLSGHVTLSGHKLNLVTTIAGHNLRMKIGSLTMNFQCDATIRFDAASQTLYIRPLITELQSTGTEQADIASTIVLLFNNQEFPISLGNFKPITRKTGDKSLTFTMNINEVNLQPDNLLLSIIPAIEVRRKTN